MGGDLPARRPQAGAGALTSGGQRVVRVLPDVPAIDKLFDYTVPEAMGPAVRVGSVVRIELHGRRVRGWVVADDVVPPPGVRLRPLAKVTGWGPSPEIVELTVWAAHRWAGKRSLLLGTASAPGAVPALPRPLRHARAAVAVRDELAADAVSRLRAVLRLAPSADRFPVVEAAAALGPTLVVTPSVNDAVRLVRRLDRSGRTSAFVPRDWAQATAGVDVVVGSRAAAWAPVEGLQAVVVLDAHDERLQEERTPTWNAWVVAAERARRAGAPAVLVTPCPTLEQLAWGPVLAPPRTVERAGWTALEVVDRRNDDPRSGLFSEPLATLLRRGGRVVCVLNRRGRAKLLSCEQCRELARCTRCDSSVEQGEAGDLRCRRCGEARPPVCAHCGSQRLRNLRMGVARAAEELAALAGRPVAEVTATTSELPDAEVVLGTEAVLHRVDATDAVVFLDFDQELVAPRYRAAEEALALLARASRLVRGRERNGRVLVQTRLPDHAVLDAALHGDPARLAAVDEPVRRALRLPPVVALARVSGAAAPAFVSALGGRVDVEVTGPSDGAWLVRAADHEALAAALAAVPRPAGRLRVEVDPQRA